MARNTKIDENQLDLFSTGAVNQEASVKEEVIEPQVVAVIKEAVAQVEQPVETVVQDNTIKGFLQAKEETVQIEQPQIEIAGQVKFTRDSFINSVPVESRFVSLSTTDDNIVVVTPYQEDGSLTLKTMKENFPNFVTQLQKVDDATLIDSVDNMSLLDRLERIIEGKKIASINVDVKQIESEISHIDKLESGEDEILEDEVKPEVKTGNKNKMKM